jgi:heat shock protein HslJ
MKTKLLVTGLSLLILLSGCAAAQANLPGTNWQMVSVGGTPAIANAAPTLSFGENSMLTGWDGCNQFTGSYTVNGSSLTIQPGASTLMACPEDIMNQATLFTKGLGETSSYKADKANMTLKNASGADLMEFAVLVPPSLTSGTWEAVNVNNGNQAVVGLVSDTTITAIFGSDGSLSGNAGCNTYNTSYKTDGNKIKIEPAATTMMACPDEVMAQEFQYLKALESASVYSIRNNQLEFRDAQDAMQVLYNLK